MKANVLSVCEYEKEMYSWNSFWIKNKKKREMEKDDTDMWNDAEKN